MRMRPVRPAPDHATLAAVLRTEVLSAATLLGVVVERLLDEARPDVERVQVLVQDAHAHAERAFALADELACGDGSKPGRLRVP